MRSDFTTNGTRCRWARIIAVAGSTIILAVSQRTASAGSLSLFTSRFPPNLKLAIVWLDHRVKGPPDRSAPFLIVPQYNPRVPYDPNNPDTSPLEPPPHKGGFAYLGEKVYDGLSLGPDPELTNPADIYGYGRAFNLPSRLPPTGGNAPPLLLSVATEARPPDAAAIAASGGVSPGSIDTAHAMVGRGVPATQPTSQPTVVASSSTRLAAAFVLEDERHARASLPAPVPPR